MILILGLLSPIISAILFDSLLRHFAVRKFIFFLFFVIATLYFSIVTTGHEGPIYRIYVCIITLILLAIVASELNTNSERFKIKLLCIFSLLIIILLLVFSDGVCGF